MKGITLKQFGGVENLKLQEVPQPAIGANEVLIKTKAIGINPVDAFLRQHAEMVQPFLQPAPGQDTFILGWDVSGTVVATGEGVTQFREGDEVFGMVNFKGQGKTYAEYVAAPAGHLALKPANISHQEAAAACLAALTAWQSLVHYAKVQKGDKVLIHAAAGGVGHYAVQIAKYLGAYVVANVSAGKKDFVLSLGADEVIDYTKDKFEEKIKDADVVLDPIYGDHILRSLEAVKKGGRVISLMAFFNDPKMNATIKEKNLYTHRHDVTSNGEDMQQIARLLKEGHLKSHIAADFPFADLPKAHTRVEEGKTMGKIVVSI
jgi:NADPH:quinone reductase-like Zn-dependent oxidoreductase